MVQPYVGEIRLFAGNYNPAGWMLCQGQLLPISEYDTLFNLIGTTYGGDGIQTFGLPDLQGRVPLSIGNNGTSNYVLGEPGGVENVTLSVNQLPSHNHAMMATTAVATTGMPNTTAILASPSTDTFYATAATSKTALASSTIASSGNSLPHSNIQPSLAINYIISLYGTYPSQS